MSGINYWLQTVDDPSKINLGIASFGRSFTLTNPDNSSLYAPATAGLPGPYTNQTGLIGYNEVRE